MQPHETRFATHIAQGLWSLHCLRHCQSLLSAVRIDCVSNNSAIDDAMAAAAAAVDRWSVDTPLHRCCCNAANNTRRVELSTTNRRFRQWITIFRTELCVVCVSVCDLFLDINLFHGKCKTLLTRSKFDSMWTSSQLQSHSSYDYRLRSINMMYIVTGKLREIFSNAPGGKFSQNNEWNEYYKNKQYILRF